MRSRSGWSRAKFAEEPAVDISSCCDFEPREQASSVLLVLVPATGVPITGPLEGGFLPTSPWLSIVGLEHRTKLGGPRLNSLCAESLPPGPRDFGRQANETADAPGSLRS